MIESRDETIVELAVKLAERTRAKTLDLCGKDVSSIPANGLDPSRLSAVNCFAASRNKTLRDLPGPEFSRCFSKSLTTVDLNECTFAAIPPCLSSFTSLTFLDLSHNEITGALPGCFPPTLKSLDLSWNVIDSLGSALSKLTALTRLDLSHNNISEVPIEIVDLCALGTLRFADLSYNCRLQSLPNPTAGSKHNLATCVMDVMQTSIIEAAPPWNVVLTVRNSVFSALAQEVLPGLWLGGIEAASNKQALKRIGITHVLNVAEMFEEACFPQDFTYKVLHCADSPVEDLGSKFDEAIAFIDAGRSPNAGGCLCHCLAGMSRSATVVAAYLVRRKAMTPKAAIDHIRKVRSLISPNPGFMSQLVAYHRRITAEPK